MSRSPRSSPSTSPGRCRSSPASPCACRSPRPARRAATLTTRVRGTVRWESLLKSEPIAADVERPSAEDVAVIQYTSGTTGHPKGATLTHLNLNANAAQARAWVPTIERGTSVVYAVLPMFHAYGLTLCLTFAMSMGVAARAVPQVRPGARAQGDPQAPADLPARRASDLRAADGGRRRTTRCRSRASRSPSPARCRSPQSLVEPWEKRDRRLPRRGLRPVRDLARAHGQPGRRHPPGRHRRAAAAEHRGARRRPGEPHGRPRAAATRANSSCAARRSSAATGRSRTRRMPSSSPTPPAAHPGSAPATSSRSTRTASCASSTASRSSSSPAASTSRRREVEEALKAFPGVADAAVVGLPSTHSGEDVVAAVVLRAGRRARRGRHPGLRSREPHGLQGAATRGRRGRAAEVAHRQDAAARGAGAAARRGDSEPSRSRTTGRGSPKGGTPAARRNALAGPRCFNRDRGQRPRVTRKSQHHDAREREHATARRCSSPASSPRSSLDLSGTGSMRRRSAGSFAALVYSGWIWIIIGRLECGADQDGSPAARTPPAASGPPYRAAQHREPVHGRHHARAGQQRPRRTQGTPRRHRPRQRRLLLDPAAHPVHPALRPHLLHRRRQGRELQPG